MSGGGGCILIVTGGTGGPCVPVRAPLAGPGWEVRVARLVAAGTLLLHLLRLL